MKKIFIVILIMVVGVTIFGQRVTSSYYYNAPDIARDIAEKYAVYSVLVTEYNVNEALAFAVVQNNYKAIFNTFRYSITEKQGQPISRGICPDNVNETVDKLYEIDFEAVVNKKKLLESLAEFSFLEQISFAIECKIDTAKIYGYDNKGKIKTILESYMVSQLKSLLTSKRYSVVDVPQKNNPNYRYLLLVRLNGINVNKKNNNEFELMSPHFHYEIVNSVTKEVISSYDVNISKSYKSDTLDNLFFKMAKDQINELCVNSVLLNNQMEYSLFSVFNRKAESGNIGVYNLIIVKAGDDKKLYENLLNKLKDSGYSFEYKSYVANDTLIFELEKFNFKLSEFKNDFLKKANNLTEKFSNNIYVLFEKKEKANDEENDNGNKDDIGTQAVLFISSSVVELDPVSEFKDFVLPSNKDLKNIKLKIYDNLGNDLTYNYNYRRFGKKIQVTLNTGTYFVKGRTYYFEFYDGDYILEKKY